MVRLWRFKEYQVWKNGEFTGAVRLYDLTKEAITEALGIEVTCLKDDHPHHDILQVNDNIQLEWFATVY